jgi:general secretion pathway protein E
MPQNVVSTEFLNECKEYLQLQGYIVKEDVILRGKSGVQHTFDMIAEKNDGFSNYNVCVCFTQGGDPESEANTIYSFANQAFDTGISNRLLIAVPTLDEKSKHLATGQRISVVDSTVIKSILANPQKLVKPLMPVKFDTPADLVESLEERGYKVDIKGIITGKSGIKYKFDIIARYDIDQINRILVIDYLSSDNEVGIEQVLFFDAKAFDANADDKAIVVSPGLTAQARQFAQHQRIKVIEWSPTPEYKSTETVLEQKNIEPKTTEKRPTEPIKAISTDNTITAPKILRQMLQPDVMQLIPEVMARRYNAIPLYIAENVLHVAMADTTDIFAIEAFSSQSHMRVYPVAADARDIREAIDFSYKAYGEIERQIARINIPEDTNDEKVTLRTSSDTPLTQAFSLIVDEAVKARASDIHIEPEEDRLRIRYRIDGILQDMMSLPLNIHRSLISRIKILSDLNIADHTRPQDGQFTTASKGRQIDIRVATAPTVWGEMAVLRLLDKSMVVIELSELGMLDSCLTKYQEMLKVPYGMILISGPTGAGKTTTLYASVNALDKMGRNIITIEEPAEYRFKDINQIQVNNQAGITFASGLRSILRLDPDVILVGEIRDAETAGIAVQAALTGHLMLSSVHANDTVGVLYRLLDLKIEGFLLASSIIGVVAQRMVRRICPDCAQMIEVPAMEQIAYEQETGERRTKFLYGTGCKSCAYTGYLGRIGIFETLVMTDTLRVMITNMASSTDIKKQALREGMISLMKDGMNKVKAGITTPTEVLRSAYTMA